jgi:hypothetical protein
MARTNLHELASNLLGGLSTAAGPNGTFEGKLREVAVEAGLNSVRTAEAVKLLEDLGRIEVVQRGRRGRSTIINIKSTERVSLEDAEASLPSKSSRRQGFSYEDIGRALVDRLLDLSRDDGLRSAQVEAFAIEARGLREEVSTLQNDNEASQQRERDLRVKLRAAEEALNRSEENLRRTMSGSPRRTPGEAPPAEVPDDDARALLDILRSSNT